MVLAVSEKFNLFRNFIFSFGKHRKGQRVFHDPNQNNFRFPFLNWRKRPLCIVRDRRQETENIKLYLALCWLFDVKRFVTDSDFLISFPLRQFRATITSQNRALNRPTQQQILSGRVLKQLEREVK